jgi:hypothetical protein
MYVKKRNNERRILERERKDGAVNINRKGRVKQREKKIPIDERMKNQKIMLLERR